MAPRTTSASVSRSPRHLVAAECLAGWQEDVERVSAGRAHVLLVQNLQGEFNTLSFPCFISKFQVF